MDFPGPIAKEITLYALTRQVLEDGPHRSSSFSAVGTIPGGLNREVIERSCPKYLVVKKMRAKDGQLTYALYGAWANVASCVLIANLYDSYIMRWSCFTLKDRAIWEQGKSDSRMIANGSAGPREKVRFRKFYGARMKLLKKADHIYGPNGGTLVNYRNILWKKLN